MSISREQMVKGLDALESLIHEQAELRRDGLIFIFEQGLWDKFMNFHAEKHMERLGEQSKKG